MVEETTPDGYHTGTISIRKKMPGFVDIEGKSFSIRLSDEQAMDVAFAISYQAALLKPAGDPA
ncbi:hypothetical protein NKW43_13195 [Gluconobacter albidus]|uniref:Uncharacterized protein n=1 Tax=Gluconobacter albidus TaxID=318683 RepID=A0AAW3QVH3_9PROT|nr:hypothetical protein [Gluconobacter albidus]KXV37036.1 hypothetical protein AD941_12260 [Gluconobacter albidus]MCP1274624.1 hypothetical protein [Gluconobacter albidus]GBQ86754.1 hypothetical protein AA3250_1117 [Gluconobacter albidus NBRC 3250]GLQ69191.1 hypothetical protein GCM10007866_16420 [Gluconobacter albidus]